MEEGKGQHARVVGEQIWVGMAWAQGHGSPHARRLAMGPTLQCNNHSML